MGSDLGGNRLGGGLSPLVGGLTNLTVLCAFPPDVTQFHVSHNRNLKGVNNVKKGLRGELPPEIYHLHKLDALFLSYATLALHD